MGRSVDPNNNEIYGVLQINHLLYVYTYWLHIDPDNNENYGVLQIDKPPFLCIHILVTHSADNNEIYGMLQINKPPSLCIHILVTHRSR